MPVEAELTSVDTTDTDLADRGADVRAAEPSSIPVAASRTPAGGHRGRAWAVAVVVAAVSPIVLTALALVGDPWMPMSDWSSMVYRVSQVGTSQTPLVGPYSFHGFAHPGPLVYWVSAPLYRLTGGDPRSLLWTGALVNVVTVAALGAVAWRRGRWPLLLGTMTLVGLLVHGMGPAVTADMWNPYVALLPFLLTVFLIWDAGLGRRRALLEAAIPATFAAQAHLAFLTLIALLLLWLLAWNRLKPRIVPDPAQPDGERPWRRRRLVVVGLGLLWLAPLLDAVADLHNPLNIGRALLAETRSVGLADAFPLVGQHVRLDGLWVTGDEPTYFEPPLPAVDSLHLVVALALTGACLYVARRRRLTDVAALATLPTTLLLGAVPAAAQLVTPTASYLTEWIKLVGGLAWFTVGWTGWRLAEPAVLGATPPRRRVAVAVAAVALVGAAAWSWSDASGASPPHSGGSESIQAVRTRLDRVLDRDRTYRVEVIGDPSSHHTGLVYWMIHDGFDVVTSDGAGGLKWGHDHRWSPGDPYDTLLTIAVRTPWDPPGPYDRCHDDPQARELFAYDGLTRDERAWLDDVTWRFMGDPDSVTDGEQRRAMRLAQRNVQIAAFEGPTICG